MTIENDDRLLVNRADKSYQIKYEKIKKDITDGVKGDINAFPEAPEDGEQYGRENGRWTKIVHTPEYTDADVDDHLNTTANSNGKILSYDGSDYVWVDDKTGGDGGGTDGDAKLFTYTHPSGTPSTVQKRLEQRTSVKDFGAKGDGITDDTNSIQAAIDWVGDNGGGTVYFPPGTYMVELKGTKASGTNSWHQCALSVNYDNVHLVGAGQGATVIRSIATSFQVLDYGKEPNTTYKDTSYGLIEVIKYPFGNAGGDENGNNAGTPVQGGSISGISFDNNCASDLVCSGGVVHLKHTYNYTVENVTIQNSPFYGLAMQNGGFRNVTLNNLRLQEINRDGIDLKDNGNMSEGIQINNIYCKKVCRGDLNPLEGADDPNPNDPNEFSTFAAIDVQGMGLQLNNISIVDMGSDMAGCGVRIKQAGKDGKRGNSGRMASINNVYIRTGKTLKYGIQVKAGNVSISNAKIITSRCETGIGLMQNHCSVTNSYIEGCTVGLDLNKRSKTGHSEDNADDKAVLDAEFPDGLGADFAMIQSNAFANCLDCCVRVRRPKCNVSNNTFRQAPIGIDANDGIVDTAVITGNIFHTTIQNDISVNNNKALFRDSNIGDWAPRIYVTNYSDRPPILHIEGSDGDKAIKIDSRGIGFYGTNPVAKQETRGKLSGNDLSQTNNAVKDLIRNLAQIGLIKDGTN